MRRLTRMLFDPLHLHSARLPKFVQAIVAPVQTMHLRILDTHIAPGGCCTLEAAVRSALLPSEHFDDVERWRGNLRLLAWLRNAYLRTLPESQERLPAARAHIRRRLQQPQAPPPSLEEARALFGLAHPTGALYCGRLERAITRAADGTSDHNCTGLRGSTHGVDFGTVLEASGGLIAHRGAWAAYAEEHGVYELVTRELMSALAVYLHDRRAALLSATDKELRVLEVGAGNGELSHHLRQELRSRQVPAQVIACDNGAWPLDAALRFDGVEALSYRAALRKHEPHVVLCSWMPMGADWTADFRACGSVREYLLLGECVDGACGHNFLTWGNAAFATDESTDDDAAHTLPPSARDGWARREIVEISRWQLSRFAADVEDCEYNSCCVSFRRGG